jgi:hypothetical protein
MSRLALAPLYGKRVKVYRNLHAGKKSGLKVYSVVHDGRVVAHVSQILLQDVEFRVQPAGQKKVRETKRKNVHAFIVGTVIRSGMGIDATGRLPCPITYNPYTDDKFVCNCTPKSYVREAMTCVINEQGVSAAYTVSTYPHFKAVDNPDPIM